ncbi:RrF2 family transcriptional regulator [Gorillibacterium massiliense]|uniref:RrF2 family transcriptional regulator n=1 Tax=Gorillibacterium massiliense TaxID=1280390 RepID=UPI0004B7EDD4|nr:Rrf2 family transcriptional regulator [Gorillibacterium massiliense]
MSTVSRGINIGPPRFKIAVHSVVRLAKSGCILSSAMIAGQVQSHATFMRRVMQALTNAGIVESRGGREGGYILRKPADQITLAEIYLAVQAPSCDEEEFELGCGKAGVQLNRILEKTLQEAEERAIEYLRKYTVADIMEGISFPAT